MIFTESLRQKETELNDVTVIVKFVTDQNVFHVTDPDISSHIHEVGNSDLQIRVHIENYFSNETYVMSTQKNCLDETVLLSTQNLYLNQWVRK